MKTYKFGVMHPIDAEFISQAGEMHVVVAEGGPRTLIVAGGGDGVN